MSHQRQSRRQFFGASAGVTAAVAAALADPPDAAAQSVGVKKADLPDLTIKEVKVYVADVSSFRRLNSGETGEILSVVTNSGHEGNYTLGNRSRTLNWLEWAKPALLGKNVIDLLPAITATTGTKETFGFSGGRTGTPGGGRVPAGPATATAGPPPGAAAPPSRGGTWPNYYTAAAEICLWDILGKAVNRPIYKLLGGSKDRVMAYASSQHLANIEDYIPDVLSAKEQGYKEYKIHPGGGQPKAAWRFPRISATSKRSRPSAKPWATISFWRMIPCIATTSSRPSRWAVCSTISITPGLRTPSLPPISKAWWS